MGMTKYDRLLYILNLLRARKNLNAALLARECEVTERSIYRDILALSEANIPIYYDNGYKLASDNFLPPLNFTFEEFHALRLALESSPLNQTGAYKKTLREIRAKVEAGLSPQVREKRRRAVDTTHIDITVSQARKRGERFYHRIEQAAGNNQCLELTYESIHSGESTRVVEPYFIIFRGRAFYFVGFCRMRGELRTFRIDRVVDVRTLDEHFVRQPGVTARQYFEGSWEVFSGEPVEVVARFSGLAARIIDTGTHHPDEQVEKLDGGDVRYQVTVRGLEEIRRWLLGFGDEVVVEKPDELRAAFARVGRFLAGVYRQDEFEKREKQ